ncbi:uncharacterized protein SAPINGB_P002915 [Magnusiomyces paraingens]|uniref:mRNA-capping enzyme subunit beta n=1 Tax=Magnusiomyces paraingens TaxID=2606893 RepID=A0A5E8BQ52_9ASCO|nr:uncharacterized protein SAPINGB_P002915 [Saprochaete ingens]VVT50893.1 unnamed protein product [Saprochaete ingens]
MSSILNLLNNDTGSDDDQKIRNNTSHSPQRVKQQDFPKMPLNGMLNDESTPPPNPLPNEPEPVAHSHTNGTNDSDSNRRSSAAEINYIISHNGPSLPSKPSDSPHEEKPLPHHYETPPIWAQSCRPGRFRKEYNPNVSPFVVPSNEYMRRVQMERQQQQQQQLQYAHQWQGRRPVLFYENIALKKPVVDCGLPYSFFDMMPYDDISRKIVSWLYANLDNIKNNGGDLNNLEVEIKLGKIIDKSTDRRINFPIVTETLLDPEFARASTRFEAGVEDELIKYIQNDVDKAAKKFPDSEDNTKHHHIRNLGSRTTTDQIYHFSRSDAGREIVKPVRVTMDENNREVERITKKNVASHAINLPGSLLDLRISINLELPQNPMEYDVSKLRPISTRKKDRISYETRGLRIDITRVKATSSIKPDIIYTKEVELEFDNKLLVDWFEKASSGEDENGAAYMEELVRLNLDSARLIVRHASDSRQFK